MGWPVVIVTSGGIPVTESNNGFGTPVDVATNGFGTAITIIASGGLPVVGSGGGHPLNTLIAGKGTFVLNGDDMTPKSAFVAPAALGTFALTGVDATLTYTPVVSSLFIGSGDVSPTAGGTTVNNFTVTMPGSSGRLVFGTMIQGAQTISSVVYDPGGANVSLTKDFDDGSIIMSIWSANVPSASGSKTIAVTYSTSVTFNKASGVAWLGPTIATGFVTGKLGSPITVGTGELLFSFVYNLPLGAGFNWSGSTTSPTATRYSTIVAPNATQVSASADWVTPAVGSFVINPLAGSAGSLSATYK